MIANHERLWARVSRIRRIVSHHSELNLLENSLPLSCLCLKSLHETSAEGFRATERRCECLLLYPYTLHILNSVIRHGRSLIRWTKWWAMKEVIITAMKGGPLLAAPYAAPCVLLIQLISVHAWRRTGGANPSHSGLRKSIISDWRNSKSYMYAYIYIYIVMISLNCFFKIEAQYDSGSFVSTKENIPNIYIYS